MCPLGIGDFQPVNGPQPEVDLLGYPILGRQSLFAFPGIDFLRKTSVPIDVSPDVPSPDISVELVSARTNAGVRHTAPVGGVVTRAAPGLGKVRDLVVL